MTVMDIASYSQGNTTVIDMAQHSHANIADIHGPIFTE